VALFFYKELPYTIYFQKETLSLIFLKNKSNNMKKIFTILLILSSTFSFAQNAKTILLTKGQEIEISTTSSSESELSMGMSINNNTATTSKLLVVDEDQESYTLTSTLTKIKVSMEGMGQNAEYDSEKSEDKDSEIGKAMSDKLNKVTTYHLNKVTGKITDEKGKESDDNSGDKMGLSMSRDATSGTSDAFLIITSDKNVGDSWSETISSNGLTTKKNYKILSIQNDIANVELKGTTTGTSEQEMQGNSIKMKTDATLDGKITSNIKTGLVYMIKIDADINGTVEAMGQEMPVTSKTSTTTLFNQ